MAIDVQLLTPKHTERLWSSIARAEGDRCWIWQGKKVYGGYGQFCIGAGKRNVLHYEQVHRIVYKLLVGPIPDGLVLDHLCRNTSCVNPAHLEPVTRCTNTQRGLAVKSHCPKGHPYEGDNVLVYKAGARRCRTCVRARIQKPGAPLAAGDPRHGSIAGYDHHRCRCGLCREAKRIYRRAHTGSAS